jgi:hypothetical protein
MKTRQEKLFDYNTGYSLGVMHKKEKSPPMYKNKVANNYFIRGYLNGYGK